MPLVLGSGGRSIVSQRRQAIAQTVGASTLVTLTQPVAEDKVVGVEVYVMLFADDLTDGAVVKVEGVFVRRRGNVLRPVVPRIDLIVTSFNAPQPGLDLVANSATQSIDVELTGKSGVTIQWHLDVLFRETV